MRMSLDGAMLSVVPVIIGAYSMAAVSDCYIVPVIRNKPCPYTNTAQPGCATNSVVTRQVADSTDRTAAQLGPVPKAVTRR
jgi:hypothetical protein